MQVGRALELEVQVQVGQVSALVAQQNRGLVRAA